MIPSERETVSTLAVPIQSDAGSDEMRFWFALLLSNLLDSDDRESAVEVGSLFLEYASTAPDTWSNPVCLLAGIAESHGLPRRVACEALLQLAEICPSTSEPLAELSKALVRTLHVLFEPAEPTSEATSEDWIARNRIARPSHWDERKLYARIGRVIADLSARSSPEVTCRNEDSRCCTLRSPLAPECICL